MYGTMSQDFICSQSQATPATALAQLLSRFQLGTPESLQKPNQRTSNAPQASDTYWPPLWAEMNRQDRACRGVMARDARMIHQRAMSTMQVDRIVRLSIRLKQMNESMNEQTLHLAVKLLHDFSGQEGSTLDPELAELACVKLAESMNEVSHEYFKRERSDILARVGRRSREEIVRAECIVFQRVQSRLLRPTAAWFLRSCISVGGDCEEQVRNLARYINALTLYDPEMQEQPASLCAQVSLLLAVYAASKSTLPSQNSCQGECIESSFWNKVRTSTCWSNNKETIVPVFSRMCHLLTTERFLWEAQGWTAVGERYPNAARSLPSYFPPNLADELCLPLLQHCIS